MFLKDFKVNFEKVSRGNQKHETLHTMQIRNVFTTTIDMAQENSCSTGKPSDLPKVSIKLIFVVVHFLI